MNNCEQQLSLKVTGENIMYELNNLSEKELAKEMLDNADGSPLDKWAAMKATKELAMRILPDHKPKERQLPYEMGRIARTF